MLLLLPDAPRVQLHYYFDDKNIHTMDAFIRNDNEKDLLAIFKIVTASLGVQIDVYSEGLGEGGLLSRWTIASAETKIGIILIVIASIQTVMSRFPVEDRRLIDLQIRNLELDNELKQRQLGEIRKDILNPNVDINELTNKIVPLLEKDYGVIWHRSNFYKRSMQDKTIQQLSISRIDIFNNVIGNEDIVTRRNFLNFVLKSDSLPSISNNEAVILLIAPVLVGDFQWKGYYNNEVINFRIEDKGFKASVKNKKVEFKNGTTIKAVLIQERKFDEHGLIKVVKNTVTVVLEISNNGSSSETVQGKKFKKEQKSKKTQLGMFGKDD